MPAPAPSPLSPPPSGRREWLEPVLWSSAVLIAFIVAACVNEDIGEVARQGVAYLFTFLTTPFVLEATTALVGIFVVFAINHRRIAREGDGWVLMEVKVDDPAPTEEPKKENNG